LIKLFGEEQFEIFRTLDEEKKAKRLVEFLEGSLIISFLFICLFH